MTLRRSAMPLVYIWFQLSTSHETFVDSRINSRDRTQLDFEAQPRSAPSHPPQQSTQCNPVLCAAGLSLRGGGGQRKLQRERAARRKTQLEQTWKKLGIDKDREDERERRPQREIMPQEVDEGERAGGRGMAAWKEAEFRLRAKSDKPWLKWGKKWREAIIDDDKDDEASENHAEDDEEDESGVEKEDVYRRINDGKGHMNCTAVDDVPSNITDINEYQEWIEDHMKPFNRWVTAEDLLEDQQHTLHERAGEALFDAADNFLEALNISEKDGPAGIVEPVVNDPEQLEAERDDGVEELEGELRDVLQLNPNHSVALATYALLLHTYYDDFDGAEVMYQRALAGGEEVGRAKALAGYASLLIDSGKDVDKAYALRAQALDIGSEDPWIRTVLEDARWSEHVSVKKKQRSKRRGSKQSSATGGWEEEEEEEEEERSSPLSRLQAQPSVGVRSSARARRSQQEEAARPSEEALSGEVLNYEDLSLPDDDDDVGPLF